MLGVAAVVCGELDTPFDPHVVRCFVYIKIPTRSFFGPNSYEFCPPRTVAEESGEAMNKIWRGHRQSNIGFPRLANVVAKGAELELTHALRLTRGRSLVDVINTMNTICLHTGGAIYHSQSRRQITSSMGEAHKEVK